VSNSTAASLRARGLTRRCPGVEPVFPNKDQAIDYAQNRACFRSGEVTDFRFEWQYWARHSVRRRKSKAVMRWSRRTSTRAISSSG